MAKFAGHVVPGLYVVFASLWWSYNVYRDFFRSLANYRTSRAATSSSVSANSEMRVWIFRSRVWYADSLCKKLPLEIAMKLTLPIIDIMFECWVMGVMQLSNLHHSVLMVSTMLDGAVDLMVHHKLPLPKFADTVSHVLNAALGVLVLESHQHGKTPMGQSLHTYVIWTLVAVGILDVLQALFRTNASLALTRAFIYQLHGTWVIFIGFIIESPFQIDVFHWTEKTDGEQLMLVGFLFAVCWLFSAVVNIAFGSIIHCLVTKSLSASSRQEKLSNRLLDINGSTTVQYDDTERLISCQIDKESATNSKNTANGLIIAYG